jgi:hypothetical protein
MALKPDRDRDLRQDISKFIVSTTGAKGCMVCATGSVPSGAAMDQSVSQVWIAPNASGAIPLGLLAVDVVNIDLTRQILNPYKPESQLGDKVLLYTQGWVVTNFIDPASPAATVGAPAYLSGSGYITASPSGGSNDYARKRVGTFLTKKDEDGYAKVYLDPLSF